MKVPGYLEEATSMGAAIIGGVGAGVFKDFSAADRFVEITAETLPVAENSAVYEKLKPIFDRCYTSLEAGGVMAAYRKPDSKAGSCARGAVHGD